MIAQAAPARLRDRTRRLRTLLRSLACAVLLLGVVPFAQAIDPIEMSDPVLQERYIGLLHELRCMQCQNQSIADSPVGLAGDLRREVRELLEAGKSDQDVRDYMRARYGDFILFRPQYSLRNAWLWLAPAVLLVIGIGAAWRVVRGRAALEKDDPSLPDEDSAR